MARLEEQSSDLQVEVAENDNLRTDLVESLIYYGACISTDYKKTPRKLLLKSKVRFTRPLTRTGEAPHQYQLMVDTTRETSKGPNQKNEVTRDPSEPHLGGEKRTEDAQARQGSSAADKPVAFF